MLKILGLFVVLLFGFEIVQSQNIDIDLLNKINDPAPLPSDNFHRFMSSSFYGVVAAVPLAIGLNGLISKDQTTLFKGLNIGTGSASTVILTYSLKYMFNRKRPYISYPFIKNKISVNSASFPSGHTSLSFATATSLSLNYQKWYIVVPAFTWASFVAYSRMHLGVHYPTDVIAGAILGIGCAFISYKAINQMEQNYISKHAK